MLWGRNIGPRTEVSVYIQTWLGRELNESRRSILVVALMRTCAGSAAPGVGLARAGAAHVRMNGPDSRVSCEGTVSCGWLLGGI